MEQRCLCKKACSFDDIQKNFKKVKFDDLTCCFWINICYVYCGYMACKEPLDQGMANWSWCMKMNGDIVTAVL